MREKARERRRNRRAERDRQIEKGEERKREREKGKMKRGMNRNGRKKEARAIFLIMKTLLCVSFCFVVRGRYSNRALLPSSTFSPPSAVGPLAPPRPAFCTLTLPLPPPPPPPIFFFYIITCGLSRAALMGQGRRQGCRQGAG